MGAYAAPTRRLDRSRRLDVLSGPSYDFTGLAKNSGGSARGAVLGRQRPHPGRAVEARRATVWIGDDQPGRAGSARPSRIPAERHPPGWESLGGEGRFAGAVVARVSFGARVLIRRSSGPGSGTGQ